MLWMSRDVLLGTLHLFPLFNWATTAHLDYSTLGDESLFQNEKWFCWRNIGARGMIFGGKWRLRSWLSLDTKIIVIALPWGLVPRCPVNPTLVPTYPNLGKPKTELKKQLYHHSVYIRRGVTAKVIDIKETTKPTVSMAHRRGQWEQLKELKMTLRTAHINGHKSNATYRCNWCWDTMSAYSSSEVCLE